LIVPRCTAATALLLAGLSAGPLWADYAVTVVQGSLRDRPSLLRPSQAPVSQLRPAGQASVLAAAGNASSLKPVDIPGSSLRLAEVPPERLAVTRQLLQELRAKPGPQQALVVDLPADVLFDFDSAQLRRDADEPLAKAAGLLQGFPKAPIEVHGHTDAKGTATYNLQLSQRRAEAVARRLSDAAGGRTLTIRGHGAAQPVAPNAHPDGKDDPEGRQRNRRVQVVIRELPS
jgi:outer membrane protein OmpA-like peptidoglycan-associated protein